MKIFLLVTLIVVVVGFVLHDSDVHTENAELQQANDAWKRAAAEILKAKFGNPEDNLVIRDENGNVVEVTPDRLIQEAYWIRIVYPGGLPYKK